MSELMIVASVPETACMFRNSRVVLMELPDALVSSVRRISVLLVD
jgi:hypothetical protein